MYRPAFISALLCWSLLCAADEPSLDEKAWQDADTEALELDPLEVTGEGWSFEQETTLRMIRQFYNKPRSYRREDIDEWTCWIEEATGSHFNYLGCARMGDIWALQPDNGIGQLPTGIGGYGRIQVSTHPVNRWKLERALESLPGNRELDAEFTTLVLAGERPPRDIPDEAEVERFVAAYRAVNRLAEEDAPEDRQVAAIEAEGLSLDRYNRIMDLLEVYGSLKNDIGERLRSGG